MFKKIWTAEMVCEIILSCYGNEPLNSHYFSTNYPRVYAAAERLFGSWGNAITACGLDYSQIRKYRIWNRDQVLAKIQERYSSGKSLTSKHIQSHCRPLYMASIHHFKSWSAAIRAAGLDYDDIRIRRSMSREQIHDEIIGLYRRGVDLAYPNMRKNYQYLLAFGMRKLGGGSWAKARKLCGIKDNFRLHPDKRGRSTHLRLFGNLVRLGG